MGIGIMVTHIGVCFLSSTAIADWPIALFAAGAILVGTIISMLHLGRPKRLLHAFYNIASPITWEAFLTPLVLISIVGVGVASYVNGLNMVAAAGKVGTVVFGIALIYTMGKLYHLKARPSWSTPLVVYEFFLSAACMGMLGYVLVISFTGAIAESVVVFLSGLILIMLACELGLTIYYWHLVKTISPNISEILEERVSLMQYYAWLGLGLAIPFVLSVVTLFTKELDSAVVCIAFVCFMVGALFWRILFFKFAVPIKITPDIDMQHESSEGERFALGH
jgi:DMSO reductase anchor subunit